MKSQRNVLARLALTATISVVVFGTTLAGSAEALRSGLPPVSRRRHGVDAQSRTATGARQCVRRHLEAGRTAHDQAEACGVELEHRRQLRRQTRDGRHPQAVSLPHQLHRNLAGRQLRYDGGTHPELHFEGIVRATRITID
jgi:hypothetical protein